MSDEFKALRYRQFVTSDSWGLFNYILSEEKKDIFEKMTNEPDKDKLYILQKQLQTLDKLPNIIQSRSEIETETN